MALCSAENLDRTHELGLSHFGYIPFGAIASGTGGTEKPRLQTLFEPKTHPPALYGGHSWFPADRAVAPRDQLKFIRETLKLNVSELASILRVSRPTVYAWLEGDEPSPENYSGIVRMRSIADQVAGLAIPRFEKLLRRPVFEGQSFLDKLKSPEDPTVYLFTLKQVADKEQTVRGTSKGLGGPQNEDGFLEQTTPLYKSD